MQRSRSGAQLFQKVRVMNMLGLKYRLSCINVVMLYFFVSIYGQHEGVFPRCKVSVMVQRGTTVKTIPQQPVTVRCPVKHCGNSLKVTWFKLLNTGEFGEIGNTTNAEIWQNNSSLKDELISYLTFKRITVYDDGLYICQVYGNKHDHLHVSHSINISVSDTHQGVKLDGRLPASSMSPEDDHSASWRPYFYICGGIALLVFTLIALTLLHFYGHKLILTDKSTRTQKINAHMIPDLPKWREPSSPSPKAQYALNDIYSPSTAKTPPTPGN